ncbi:hypothetical protein Pint_30981 [Pistacia integerrima]|uniref:Uncharacterized protein n=1 Tax=Pistacia integerrima TaxID=434235 RepID=A0ACC0XL04_9ROSI|nr:hypothetical protein Pint_30981 [Pistacia integerrima]
MAAVSNGYNSWRRRAHRSSEHRAQSVPIWERKFCWEVGSVPWKRIVEAKKYMNIFDRVVEWDDSACEEAFKKAKLRYWFKITGQPQRISLPNRDMFIDEIDWNAEIDPAIFPGLGECSGDDEEEQEEEEEKEKKNVNVVNSFDVPWHQIKPTGWDLYERKCQSFKGMVVGE